MTRDLIWDVLGIAPTANEAEVRRAYAAKLRITNPEDDAEGFKQLRAAYDRALFQARHANAYVEDNEEDEATDQDEEFQPSAPSENLSEGSVAGAKDVAPERAEHGALCSQLIASLSNEAPDEDRQRSLQSVLTSAAMADVDVYAHTELWLAELVVQARPASDALVEDLFAFFKWDQQLRSDGHYLIQRAADVRDRIRGELGAKQYRERLSKKGHEFYRAYKEFQVAPKARSWISKLLSLGHTQRVLEFIQYARRFPVFWDSLDQESIRWWSSRTRAANALGLVSVLGVFALIFGVVAALFAIADTGKNNGRSFDRTIASFEAPDPPPAPPTPQQAAQKRARVLERVPPELRERYERQTGRRDCTENVMLLRKLSAAAFNPTLAMAEDRCEDIVHNTPDALLMRQYAGIVALRGRRAEAAWAHFNAILELSPDDAYALYGRGLVALAGPDGARLGKTKDMSDALAMNPEVETYFDEFQLASPGVEASEKKPRSKLPKRAGVPADVNAEQIETTELTLDTAADYFGLYENFSGETTINCLIGENGRVRNCVVATESVPNEGLGEVALYLSKGLRFKPATLGGEPVDGVPLNYTYRLN